MPTVRHEIEGERTADSRFSEVEPLGHVGDNRRDEDGDGCDPRASLAPFQAVGQLHQHDSEHGRYRKYRLMDIEG